MISRTRGGWLCNQRVQVGRRGSILLFFFFFFRSREKARPGSQGYSLNLSIKTLITWNIIFGYYVSFYWRCTEMDGDASLRRNWKITSASLVPDQLLSKNKKDTFSEGDVRSGDGWRWIAMDQTPMGPALKRTNIRICACLVSSRTIAFFTSAYFVSEVSIILHSIRKYVPCNKVQ